MGSPQKRIRASEWESIGPDETNHYRPDGDATQSPIYE
jgi:hypothetical protein